MVIPSEINAEVIAREDHNNIPPQKLESSSDSLSEAIFLYERKFNIFPLEYGEKKTHRRWKFIKSAGLPRERISELFEGKNNIAVLTGKLSNNLFVIDCDDQDSFKKYLNLFESRNLAKWVVITSRGGHIWFLSPEGEIDSCKLEENVQVFGNNHYVVAPPSLNKQTGVIYGWGNREGDFPPELSYDEIRDLFPEIKIIRRLQGFMPYIANEVLVNRNLMGYESYSEAENAALFSLVRLGWDDESIIELFNHYSPPHYRSRNRPEQWLKTYMLNPAREIIHVSPYIDKINRAVNWASSQTWNNRTGAIDKIVFLACCKRAMIEGVNNFRASEREIAELANTTRKTARKSLRRLVRNSVLEIVYDRASGMHYKIRSDIQDYPNKSTVLYFVNGVMSLSLIQHDVWHPKALGKTSHIIYQFLLANEGKTIPEISEGIKKSKASVTKALEKLSHFRLASKIDGVWSAILRNNRYFDIIARILGTFGVAEKRKQEYQRERENRAYAIFMKN
jgi:predicted transcriptional regulator